MKEQADMADLSSASADLVDYSPRQANAITYCICGLLACGLLWSNAAPVLEVAVATGIVIPEDHVQIVQSLEGGAVQRIVAKSGEHVDAGALLVSLDPTPSGASRDEISEQMAGLKITAIRLRALLGSTDPVFPNDLRASHPQLVAQAEEQLTAGRNEIESGLAALGQQLEARKIELSESKSRLKSGEAIERLALSDLTALKKLQTLRAAGRAEVNTAQAHFNDISGQNDQLRLALNRLAAAVTDLENQRTEKLSAFRSRNGDALAEVELKIAALSASLGAQQKRFEQTAIKSTSAGVVKVIKPTSVGQVIRPGEEVAEIVPDGNKLVVQARVKPEDIAFVHEGMNALVKFSAYDFSIFGSASGTLRRVAADSTSDDKGQVYYIVDVALPKNYLSRREERWPIKSGMVATVEIVTGSRTIFQYLTKPIHRMANLALKER